MQRSHTSSDHTVALSWTISKYHAAVNRADLSAISPAKRCAIPSAIHLANDCTNFGSINVSATIDNSGTILVAFRCANNLTNYSSINVNDTIDNSGTVLVTF